MKEKSSLPDSGCVHILDNLIIAHGFPGGDQGDVDLFRSVGTRRIPALIRNVGLAVKGRGRRIGDFFQTLLELIPDFRFEGTRPFPQHGLQRE